MTRRHRDPLARRILEWLLPDDDWSREFLSEIDADVRGPVPDRGTAPPRLAYLRRLLSAATLRFVILARRRAQRTAERDRSAWTVVMADTLLDFRHAVRRIRREPRTAFFIASTLALGLGSVSAVYGVADRLFLSGPPHVERDTELYRVFLAVSQQALGTRTTAFVPFATARAIQGATLGGRAALYRFGDDLVQVESRVSAVRVSEVDGSYFAVLETTPFAGTFSPLAAAQEEGVAVLSYTLASDLFGDPASAVGKPIALADGGSSTVVGVAPEGFSGPHLERVDVWAPLQAELATRRNWFVFGRSTAGPVGSTETARLETAAQAALDRTDPGRSFQWAVGARVHVRSIDTDDSGEASAEASVARLLLSVVGLVLLVGLVNVVNLLLARLTGRRSEVAVRLALGGGRWRLARLSIAECMTLSLLGAALSVPVAYVAGSALRSVLLPQVAWSANPVDLRMLGLTALAAIAVGLTLGVLPALATTGADLSRGIGTRRVAGSGRSSRTQFALSTAQIALSAVLLMCAGLFIESFRTIRVTDLGVDPDEVLAVRLRSMSAGGLSGGSEGERVAYERALDVVRQMNGGATAALTVGLPFRYTFGMSVWVPGLDSIPQLPGGGPYVSAVTDRYFEAAGTRLLSGTGISSQDIESGRKVVVANASAAALLWPTGDPLGRCVRLGTEQSDCFTVVGVAEDVHQTGYREARSLQFYFPLGLQQQFSGTLLVVRPQGSGTASFARSVRSALAGVHPEVDFVEVERLSDSLAGELRPWRLGAVVLTVAALIAATVSFIGVYGVLTYLVTQRRREIGVRIALGASVETIRGMVVRIGLVSGALGVSLGFAVVLAARGWLGPLLFETAVGDPLVMGLVGATLVIAACVACLLPASQASSVPPVECLRAEE